MSSNGEAALLANPVWHALNTVHAHFATGTRLAKRYPPEVARAVGVANHGEAALRELAQIVPVAETVAILKERVPSSLPDWTVQQHDEVIQMICGGPVPDPDPAFPRETLTPGDVPEMLQLIELTHPGPFAPRTIEMGRYIGVRREGRLVAMAGERFAVQGYREISAVCTHPDFQGRGLARQLVSHLVNANFAPGIVPFLHVRPENTRASALYERLNFRESRRMVVLIVNR